MIDASLALALIASAYLAISVVVAGRRKPGYRHTRHTISELAEYGSEFTHKVSLGLFLPVAISIGAVAWLARLTDPPIAALALSITVGYGLGAMFPCDPGSPMKGSVRQATHNLGGGIQYVGGAMSLLWMGETAWSGFSVAGILVGISAILLSFESRLRGSVQRVAETLLFSGLVAALWMR